MYVLPNPESAQRAIRSLPPGPFCMINLYRLRAVADYSAHPELAPATPVSGRELFDRFSETMQKHLAAVGAERIFRADGGPCLIGPPDERWDVVQLVRYPSLEAFLALGANPEMRAEMPHRIAMMEDSRVFPLLADVAAYPK